MAIWTQALELDSERQIVGGSDAALCDAIRNGADLRVCTAFRHNEHIDTSSDDPELIREAMDFRVTYLVDDRWVAAIENLRVPIGLPSGFGPRISMSYFMYNQNALQALARPHFDGQPASGEIGSSPVQEHPNMPKYEMTDAWDMETNAPSFNFIYDFDSYRFMVNNNWQEVLGHDADGQPLSGSIEALETAVSDGCEVKVGIRGLCDDLAEDSDQALDHTVFVHIGACYNHTVQKRMTGASNPLPRVKPGIPMRYESRGWDFGWLMPRSDGYLARWLCDPYTMKFEESSSRHAMRWFVLG